MINSAIPIISPQDIVVVQRCWRDASISLSRAMRWVSQELNRSYELSFVIQEAINIFADLGLPNAEEHLLKAALVVQLKRLIAERELTQTVAAKLIGMKQPDLSKLLRGDFRLVSVEKLMRMLTAFAQDVEITLKPHRKRGEAGRITFIAVAT
jgi:predicted XRE-type DNA-binding protein